MRNKKRRYPLKENMPFEQRKNKYYLRKNWWYVILVIVMLCVMAVFHHSVQQHKFPELQEAQILYVVDGDTISVRINGKEQRIRLIGVDAPESINSDEELNSVYGQYASEYTKSNLQEGRIVYLTFDKERVDPYDRMLAYVWLTSESEDINNLYQMKMVTDGYALSVCYEPNTMYYTELSNAMTYAIAKKNGLWAYEEFYDKNAENDFLY